MRRRRGVVLIAPGHWGVRRDGETLSDARKRLRTLGRRYGERGDDRPAHEFLCMARDEYARWAESRPLGSGE